MVWVAPLQVFWLVSPELKQENTDQVAREGVVNPFLKEDLGEHHLVLMEEVHSLEEGVEGEGVEVLVRGVEGGVLQILVGEEGVEGLEDLVKEEVVEGLVKEEGEEEGDGLQVQEKEEEGEGEEPGHWVKVVEVEQEDLLNQV